MTKLDGAIYVLGGFGATVLTFGFACDVHRWLKDRRQEMRMASVIHSGGGYSDIQPMTPEEENDIHEFCVAAERAVAMKWIKDEDEYASWVESGLHWANVHAYAMDGLIGPEDLEAA